MKEEPFCYNYTFSNDMLLKFYDQIRALNFKSLYFIKKFMNVLNRYNPRLGKRIYKKVDMLFNY